MGMHRPVPDVLAMLICDQIITDRLTGKQSIIGLFSKIHTRGFPATHPQLCVYVVLTEGHGETELTIRIVDTSPRPEGAPRLVGVNPNGSGQAPCRTDW